MMNFTYPVMNLTFSTKYIILTTNKSVKTDNDAMQNLCHHEHLEEIVKTIF